MDEDVLLTITTDGYGHLFLKNEIGEVLMTGDVTEHEEVGDFVNRLVTAIREELQS